MTTKQKIEEYLDRLIKAANMTIKATRTPCKINKQICIDTISYFVAGVENKPQIQLYQGARAITEILGLDLVVIEDYYKVATLLSFNYGGFEFIQVEDE